jgi:hypothetical protein
MYIVGRKRKEKVEKEGKDEKNRKMREIQKQVVGGISGRYLRIIVCNRKQTGVTRSKYTSCITTMIEGKSNASEKYDSRKILRIGKMK